MFTEHLEHPENTPMVKLLKTALQRLLHNTRRMPSLIELQAFFSDELRIVNDRRLNTLCDQPNDLAPIFLLSFLRQELAPNKPMGECHETEDFRRDSTLLSTILPWPIVFGLGGCSPTFLLYMEKTNVTSSCERCGRHNLQECLPFGTDPLFSSTHT